MCAFLSEIKVGVHGMLIVEEKYLSLVVEKKVFRMLRDRKYRF